MAVHTYSQAELVYGIQMAARDGDLEDFDRILALAVPSGDASACRALFLAREPADPYNDAGELIDAETPDAGTGITALHIVAANNHVALFQRMLPSLVLPADLSAPRTDAAGATPLHWACLNGQTEMVQALVEAGAEPNLKDAHGRTPMGMAQSADHEAISTYLLKHFEPTPETVDTPEAAAGLAAPPAGADKAALPTMDTRADGEDITADELSRAARAMGLDVSERDTPEGDVVVRMTRQEC